MVEKLVEKNKKNVFDDAKRKIYYITLHYGNVDDFPEVRKIVNRGEILKVFWLWYFVGI